MMNVQVPMTKECRMRKFEARQGASPNEDTISGRPEGVAQSCTLSVSVEIVASCEDTSGAWPSRPQ
jgi:hypothetical protein